MFKSDKMKSFSKVPHYCASDYKIPRNEYFKKKRKKFHSRNPSKVLHKTHKRFNMQRNNRYWHKPILDGSSNDEKWALKKRLTEVEGECQRQCERLKQLESYVSNIIKPIAKSVDAGTSIYDNQCDLGLSVLNSCILKDCYIKDSNVDISLSEIESTPPKFSPESDICRISMVEDSLNDEEMLEIEIDLSNLNAPPQINHCTRPQKSSIDSRWRKTARSESEAVLWVRRPQYPPL